jgi:hypothetical protein
MRIASIAALLLLLGSCAARPPAQDAGAPSTRRTDMYCMDDCVGNGGTREFCQQRCTD